MGKTLIRVECLDQKLIITSAPAIASGGRNEDEIEFSFCPLWAGYAKTAVFYRNEAEVYHATVTADRCIIPHEVLQDDGIMYFGVFGTKGDTTRTSEVIRYRVVKGALTTGTKPSDPTPDIYAQIATKLANIETFVGPGDPYSITGDLVQLDNYEGMPMDCVTRIEPVQAGSGDPYPAGGGKNLIPSIADSKAVNGMTFTKNPDGSITMNGTATGYASASSEAVSAAALRGKTVTLKGANAGDVAVTQIVFACDSGTVYKSCTWQNGAASYTFDVPADASTMRFEVYSASGQVATNLIVYPQLELGSESTAYAPYSNIRPISGRTGAVLTRAGTAPTEYEPHQGETFTLDFGQTVYGGSIDWGKGLLTVDRAMLTLDGSESWVNGYVSDGKNNRFELNLTDSGFGQAGTTSNSPVNEVICDAFAYHRTTSMPQVSKFRVAQTNNKIWLLFNPPQNIVPLEDVSAWKVWLAANPITVVMPLIEPTTIQLTPQQLTALQGVNYIWSDAGETTVSGRKDVLWAANYLPTATATTKGGVKVGEGLRMDGDVLGVVPEPEYELLETIVCDGTYGNLIRINLALTHAKIYVHMQAAEAAYSVGAEAKNTAGMFGYAWLGNGINTGERWSYIYFVSDGKEAYAEHYGPVLTVSVTADVARTVSRQDASTPINRINIYASGGGMFPAGSTIEIWGVSA